MAGVLPAQEASAAAHDSSGQHEHDDVKQTLIYRAFRPLMETLLKRRWVAWSFMAVVVPLMARGSLFEYLEVLYNRKRLHSSLGYVSPESFEATA